MTLNENVRLNSRFLRTSRKDDGIDQIFHTLPVLATKIAIKKHNRHRPIFHIFRTYHF